MDKVKQRSVIWRAFRRFSFRITCSELGDLFSMGYTSPNKLWIRKAFHPSRPSDADKNWFVIQAQNHGTIHEDTARQIIAEYLGVEIDSNIGIKDYKGLRCCKNKFILGGSPDGIFYWDGKKTLLEVKCPFHQLNQALCMQIKSGHLLQMIGLMEIFGCEQGLYMWYLAESKEWVAYRLDNQRQLFEEHIWPIITKFVFCVDKQEQYKCSRQKKKDLEAKLRSIFIEKVGEYNNKKIN